jgi:beta-glucosidase
LYQLAEYDNGRAEWMMEEGMYGIWVGDSLDSSVLISLVSVDKKICFSEVRNICPLKEKINELTRTQTGRSAEYRKWTEEGGRKGLPVIRFTTEDVKKTVVDYSAQPQVSDEAAEITRKLSETKLISMAKGDSGRGQMSALGSAGITVPGAAGETSSAALGDNIPSIVLADGPAGLRLERSYHVYKGEVIKKSFMDSMEGRILSERKLEDPGEVHYQFATAIPIGTLLAQSFDPELVTEIGEMIGREMEMFNVTLWLAPGMNIHRNPLCGRNFEYYSEDPLVAGTMAAAVTRGVQKNPGIGTTIKHFCCNNQEDKRMGTDAVVSERALREIYLKGFEIAVKSSQPMSIMTSYNMVNGVHSANNHDICTDVARKEWGFAGVIMTDWIATIVGPGCTAAGCMRAGNDLIMPGMDSDDADLRSELADGRLSKQDLCRSIAYLINIILQSNQYEGAVSYSEQFKAIRKYMYSEKD